MKISGLSPQHVVTKRLQYRNTQFFFNKTKFECFIISSIARLPRRIEMYCFFVVCWTQPSLKIEKTLEMEQQRVKDSTRTILPWEEPVDRPYSTRYVSNGNNITSDISYIDTDQKQRHHFSLSYMWMLALWKSCFRRSKRSNFLKKFSRSAETMIAPCMQITPHPPQYKFSSDGLVLKWWTGTLSPWLTFLILKASFTLRQNVDCAKSNVWKHDAEYCCL